MSPIVRHISWPESQTTHPELWVCLLSNSGVFWKDKDAAYLKIRIQPTSLSVLLASKSPNRIIKYEVLSSFKKGGSGYNWTKALELSLVLPSMATIAWGTQAVLPFDLPMVSAHVQLLIIVLLAIQSQFIPLQPHPFWVSACSATFPNLTDWTPPPIDWDLQPKTQPTTTSDHWTQTYLNFIPKATWGDWRILSRGIMPTHLMFGKVMLTSVQGMKEEMGN